MEKQDKPEMPSNLGKVKEEKGTTADDVKAENQAIKPEVLLAYLDWHEILDAFRQIFSRTFANTKKVSNLALSAH